MAVDLENGHSFDHLLVKMSENQVPIVYNENYNITAFGIEKLHPFDSTKWGRIIQMLIDKKILVGTSSCVEAVQATDADLLTVHTKRYLKSLKWSAVLARITEIPFVGCLPNAIVRRKLLRPLRFQTGGTVAACNLALETGWAINVGGGFHHCSADSGGGFCVYADIQMGLKSIMGLFVCLFDMHLPKSIFSLRSLQISSDKPNGVKKSLIIDLDAHQGNGHGTDYLNDSRVVILDAFNNSIYPQDYPAMAAIKYPVKLSNWIEDGDYLDKVRCALEFCLDKEKPDFVFYNAGTDIMDGDPLGQLCISKV